MASTNHQGASSLVQTTFNMSNVIMGVGVLSLPYAFQQSGWLLGIFLVTGFGLIASKSARILADIQRYVLATEGRALVTYGDIGEAVFGRRGRWFIQFIFYCELFAASVALLILTAQTIAQLLPWIDAELLKLLIWTLLTISTWPKSLTALSYGSMIGVLCLVNLLVVIITDGLWKREKPGSLWEVEETSLLPPNWQRLPFSIGLCMAGYAGHACFPGLFVAMKERRFYRRAVHQAFSMAILFYISVASLGYLMFGPDLKAGIIVDNLEDEAYPQWLYLLTMILVAINPATKYALCLMPVLVDLERIVFYLLGDHRDTICVAVDEESPLLSEECDLDNDITALDTCPDSQLFSSPSPPPSSRHIDNQPSSTSHSCTPSAVSCVWKHHGIRRTVFRTVISFIVLVVAHYFPHFDRVISLLGSLFAMTSSILFPWLCYLSLFRSETTMKPGLSTLEEPTIAVEDDTPYVDPISAYTYKATDPLLKPPSSILTRTVPNDGEKDATHPDALLFTLPAWRWWVGIVIFGSCAILGTIGTLWTVIPQVLAPA